MIGIPKFLKSILGTFTYLDAGGEQTVIEVLPGKSDFITSIFVDTNALTQNGTFKLYSKIDSTNYRLSETIAFTAASGEPAKVITSNFNFKIPIANGFKLTYQETVDEGSDRNLPYIYVLEG
jgi:hypothetical protein